MSEKYDELFKGLGVEVKLKSPENFLKIKESLQRMGIASKKLDENGKPSLYQSCVILHKQGLYGILMYKECFILDRKQATIDDTDIARRNTIASLLYEWELVDIDEEILDDIESNSLPLSQLKIIPFKERDKWNLVSKYQVGVKHYK